MMTITFGNATVQRLYFERQIAERLNHLRFYKITECLLRIHHGHAFREIADWLHISLRTVYNWLSLFIRRRFAWLCGHHFQGRGRKARLNAEQRQRLYDLIEKGPLACGFTCGVWTSSMIAVMIEREFRVTYHPRSVCRLLHQIGITYQRAAFVSDKLNDEEHERKRKRWEKETWPSILKRARQLQAVILFGDEVSFAQWGSLFRTWGPRGKQPKVPTCGKRKGMKVFGVIEVKHGDFLYMECEDKFNGEAYTRFLTRIIHKIAVSSCNPLFYNGSARNGYCNFRKETAMAQDTQIVLPFARLSGKNLQADFDGGTLSSDGGVLFLREIEAQVGVIRRFAGVLHDPRDARYTDHSYEELLRQRIFQIACGYEDANDCTPLRHDPAFKAACGRLPISGDPLASQPGMSRFENTPSRPALYRTAHALFNTFVASYDRAPQSLLLDIDDTADEVHGAQQQALFNGYYDSYCYLPLHIYEGQSGKLITSILRPGRRPTGQEIVSILKRVVDAIRREWPEVLILLRGDGHFSTPEVHEWCERHEPEIVYILGQSGNNALKEKAQGILQQARFLYRCRQERSLRKKLNQEHKEQKSKSKSSATYSIPDTTINEERPDRLKVKLYTEFAYQAGSWSKPRRIICKVEVSEKGENIRFIVTNMKLSRKAYIYETIYCGRGQMENYIKDHKLFLHSDRTSCHRFEANQFRLLLHSAAYVLMHSFKTQGLRGTAWSRSQFNQIQLRLLKVGARIEEWKTKVTLHFPSAFPLKAVYARVVANISGAELCRSP